MLKIDLWRQFTRRGLLHAGALGLSGLCLPSLLRLRSAAGADSTRKDTAVIFLFLHGGPSQLETYDLKPEALRRFEGLADLLRRTSRGSTSANCYLCMPSLRTASRSFVPAPTEMAVTLKRMVGLCPAMRA